MSGGGQGGMGGFGGGYPQGGGFGGYGQRMGGGQPYGQPKGFAAYGGNSFGGGNPWMRQAQPSYGNKMGFQGGGLGMNGQPQTGGDFQVNEGQRNFPRNDMRIPPGQGQSFTPAPLGANEGLQAAPSPNSGIVPEQIPPGAMQKPMGYGGSTLDNLKAGTMYGQGPINTQADYQPMVRGWQDQYNAMLEKPAPFGRYADGSPREDPNALNARAQAHQQWYGGGWGK